MTLLDPTKRIEKLSNSCRDLNKISVCLQKNIEPSQRFQILRDIDRVRAELDTYHNMMRYYRLSEKEIRSYCRRRDINLWVIWILVIISVLYLSYDFAFNFLITFLLIAVIFTVNHCYLKLACHFHISDKISRFSDMEFVLSNIQGLTGLKLQAKSIKSLERETLMGAEIELANVEISMLTKIAECWIFLRYLGQRDGWQNIDSEYQRFLSISGSDISFGFLNLK